MAKRKPGRPRKQVDPESAALAARDPFVKRKAGRPKKQPVAPEAAPQLYSYKVRTINDDGDMISETVQAHEFAIGQTGDLILYFGDIKIAAFRSWRGIVGEKVIDLPVVSTGLMISNVQNCSIEGNRILSCGMGLSSPLTDCPAGTEDEHISAEQPA